MIEISSSGYVSLLAVAAIAAIAGWLLFAGRQRLPNLPTLRISTKPGQLGAIEDAMLYIQDIMIPLKIGYEKYSKQGKNYLIQTPTGKEVVLADDFIEEVRRAPDDKVSNLAANNDLMQLRWTLHSRLLWDQYHFDLPIRKSLTQSLSPKLPDIVEEGKMALDEKIGRPDDWIPLGMKDLAFNVVTRTANRLLFGTDLARNSEFLQLSIAYTSIMFGGAVRIRRLPELAKPFVMWWTTDVYKQQALARKHLVPVLRERIEQEACYAREGREREWQKIKPDDAIQWVLDYSPPGERRPDRLVYRMLHINIAAVDTSSNTFLETMYCLALMPEIHDELRGEIETVFANEGGWSKQTITYLFKLDSFITEVSRLCPSSPVKLKRKLVADWKLSDGTLLPRGTTLSVNHLPRALYGDSFEEADKFDPWRMYRRRQQEGQANMHQFVMTSPDNLNFGHGKHACPGRFFAANEIKMLMALVLMRYEMKMDLPGGLEEVRRGRWFGEARAPISHGVVQFKSRAEKIPEPLKEYFL